MHNCPLPLTLSGSEKLEAAATFRFSQTADSECEGRPGVTEGLKTQNSNYQIPGLPHDRDCPTPLHLPPLWPERAPHLGRSQGDQLPAPLPGKEGTLCLRSFLPCSSRHPCLCTCSWYQRTRLGSCHCLAPVLESHLALWAADPVLCSNPLGGMGMVNLP